MTIVGNDSSLVLLELPRCISVEACIEMCTNRISTTDYRYFRSSASKAGKTAGKLSLLTYRQGKQIIDLELWYLIKMIDFYIKPKT